MIVVVGSILLNTTPWSFSSNILKWLPSPRQTSCSCSCDTSPFQSGRTTGASAAAVTTSSSSPSSGNTGGGGITDDDLLAQLAEAELDQDDFSSGGHPGDDKLVPGLSSTSSTKTAAAADGTVSVGGDTSKDSTGSGKTGAGIGDDLSSSTVQVEGVVDHELSSLGVPGEGIDAVDSSPRGEKEAGRKSDSNCQSSIDGEVPAMAVNQNSEECLKSSPLATGGTKAAPGSLQDELSQLEELERELGIMGVGGEGGTGDGGEGGTGEGKAGGEIGVEASKNDAFDMDNLDELEGYLESLAK